MSINKPSATNVEAADGVKVAGEDRSTVNGK